MKNKLNTYYLLQLASSILGLFTSLYLLIQHTRLASGIQVSASLCSIGKLADCDVVQASDYASIFGVPWAALGAIFFFALLVLGTISPPKHKSFAATQNVMGILALIGLIIDLYLLFISVYVIETICLFCVITYLLNFAHLVLNGLLASNGKGLLKGVKRSLKSRPSLTFGLSGGEFRVTLLALASWTAFIYVLPSSIWMKSNFYSYVNSAVGQFYESWKDIPSKTIPINSEDASFGNPQSKVKIVEFSDFECPHCQKASFTLHAALASMKDRVHFVFKHFPLDSACNSGVHFQAHPQACKLAQLSYCANKKGKFWEFHDKVFMSIPKNRKLPSWDKLKTQFSDIFSDEEISSCLRNNSSLRKIRRDVALGDKLGIKGTPSVFINGKKVTIPLTVETIKKLVSLSEK